MKTKIASYLSDNELKDFVLQYNDEENEPITFSSNDELRSAIEFNKDTKTLKVFVVFKQPIAAQPQPQPQQQQQQQQDPTNKDCHPGVTCDNCKGPVIGFRYKCFVCPNYDLCEKCASTRAHPEHDMIRITKPDKFQHLDDHYHRHFNEHRDRHHHHHHRHRVPPPPHPPPPPFVPSQDYLQKIQSQIPQWLPNLQNATHARVHLQQHIDALKASGQTHIQTSKQYLESVGQYLQKALTPLGIDCEYQVDGEKSTTQQQQQQEQQQDQTAANPVVTPSTTSVTSSTTESTETNNNQEQSASPTIPKVQEDTTAKDQIERAVDACMDRMSRMGFMDPNGALRELIRSKQGDINAVLDAINPRFHN